MSREATPKRVTLVSTGTDSEEARILKGAGFEVGIASPPLHGCQVSPTLQPLRQTGIDILGDMPWSTHFCQFYQTKQDLIDILVPYIKAGLTNNEFCMWVTADNMDCREAERALRASMPDFDRYLEREAIVILPYTEWYLDGGRFDRHRVLDSWLEKLGQALARGFDGVRVTGDTMWLEKSHWQDFTEYEESINDVIGDYPLLVLCTYSLDKCGSSEIADVVANHEFAVMKRAGEWIVIESSDIRQTKEALHQALDELGSAKKDLEYTNEELLASNDELQCEIRRRERYEEELRRLNRTLKAHSQSNQAMICATDESEYLQQVCRIIVEHCGHAMVWIGYAEDDEGKTVRPVAEFGFDEGYLDVLSVTWADTERGRGPTGTAIRTGKPSMCRNMLTDPRFAPWRDEALKRGYASSIALPLVGDGGPFGAVTIYSRDPDPFSADEIALLTDLAGDLTYGIRAIRLQIANRQAEVRLNALLELAEQRAAETDAIIQAIPHAVYFGNESGITRCNAEALRLLGASSPQDLQDRTGELGRRFRARYQQHGDPVESANLPFSRALQGEVSRLDMWATQAEDGQDVFIRGNAAPVLVGDEILGAVAVNIDITDQHLAQRALLISNQQLSLLSSTASELLLSKDPQQVVQGLCMSAMEHLDCHAFFNYLVDPEKQCLHLNAYAGIPEAMGREIEWLDYGIAVCGCAARDGCRIIAENIQETADPRTDLVKSFGIEAYACHPLLGHGGDVIGTLSFGSRSRTSFSDEDLALMKTIADQVATAMERMRLHNESERRAAELESFVSSMADGVSLLDADGNTILCNDVGRAILGCKPGQALHEWALENQRYTLDGMPFPLRDAPVWRALHGETVREFRYRLVTPSGKETIVSASASPVLDGSGRVVGATNVFRDIGDVMEFERQRDELYEREHHIAQVLQESAVPQSVPGQLLGCSIAARYRPALREAEIGGDFYDVFELGGGRFGILIGDIAGKGLPAAIRVAAARYTIRSYAYTEPNPGRVLDLANDALFREGGTDEIRMLTAIYAVADMDSGTLSYAIAGHEPPVIYGGDGEYYERHEGGMPIGVMSGVNFPQVSRRIEHGDTIILVTDGITEARAPGTVLFGRKGILDLLTDCRHESPHAIASLLIDAATAHAGGRLQDDAAIVVIRCEKPSR